MKIPDNYRQLKSKEIVRKDDLFSYKNQDGQLIVDKIEDRLSMISLIRSRLVGDYNPMSFWRRRHTKKTPIGLDVASLVKKPTTKKNVIEVSFDYPKKDGYLKTRQVQ